jgi:hypothetical protein
MDRDAQICKLIDSDWAIADIADEVQVSVRTVYNVLAVFRPGRKRVRRSTSELRRKIVGLLGCGIAPVRVAFLCKTSRQYVYRIARDICQSRTETGVCGYDRSGEKHA